MLDFLNTIGDVASTFSRAAGPIQDIMAAIRGPSKPQAPASERLAKSLLAALAQPNNSLVKSLADEELRNLASGAQSDIRSKVLADRRERSMGRSNVFFDPERTDENIAYQISRGTPLLRQTAQSNAIQRILQAAGVGQFAKPEALRAQEYEKSVLDGGGLAGRLESGFGGIQKILEAIYQKPTSSTPRTSAPQPLPWQRQGFVAGEWDWLNNQLGINPNKMVYRG